MLASAAHLPLRTGKPAYFVSVLSQGQVQEGRYISYTEPRGSLELLRHNLACQPKPGLGWAWAGLGSAGLEAGWAELGWFGLGGA